MASGRCRVCLQSGIKLVSVYAAIVLEEKQLQITHLLKSFCNLEVTEDDRRPQVICEKCLVEGVTCYKFKCRIEESEKILDMELNNSHDTEIIVTEEELDIKVENDSDSDVKDPDYDSNICNEAALDSDRLYANYNFEQVASTVVDQHFNKKRYGCVQCGKRFFYRLHLKIHIQTHSSSQKCNLCGLGFVSATSLQEHKKIHDIANRRYKCPECHKLYKNYSCLKLHMEGHKRYTCMECLRGFKHEAELSTHIHAEHGNNCPICYQKFKDNTALSNHMHVHLNR